MTDWLGWADLTPAEQSAVLTYGALFASVALNAWLLLVQLFRPGPKRKARKRGRR